MRNEASQTYRPKNGTGQSVTVSGTSAATSNAFGDQTRIIAVDTTVGCHINFGAAPTATTADPHLVTTRTYFFIVNPGQKLAAIQESGASGGTLYVSEMTF